MQSTTTTQQAGLDDNVAVKYAAEPGPETLEWLKEIGQFNSSRVITYDCIDAMVTTTLLKSIPMTFPDQINASSWLLLYVQCPPPKKQKSRSQIYTEGERSGQGYFPPQWG